MLGLGLQILSGLFSANTLKKLSFDGLLSGAWFHKKNIGDTEVIDETPGVDTSRTWHKARALQFNNAESVVVSNLQLCNSGSSTWKVEFEFVHTYDGNGGYLFDTRYSNDGAQSPGNGAYIQFINNAFSISGSGGGIINSQPLKVDVRYSSYLEFDGSVLRLFYKGDDGSTETLTANLTQQASGQNFYIGRRHDNSSLFRNLLGWMRITQDSIVTAEYAFEEGVGTYCFNRISNNYHGTINNATISTFRVEDVRITNGDQGTFLNTEGYSLGRLISNDLSEFNPTQSLLENNQTYKGYNDVSVLTNLAGTINRMFIRYSVPNYSSFLDIGGVLYDSTFDVYMPSDNEGVNAIRQLDSIGISYEYPTQDDWDTLSYSGWELSEGDDFRIFACVGNSINVDDVLHVGDKVGFRNFELRSTNVFYPRLAGADTNIYGNPLTYKGQVAQPLSLVNSNGGSYLSAGEYLSISSNIEVNSFTQVFLAKLDPSLKTFDDFRSIYGLSSASIYYLQSDQVYFRANGQTTPATIWSGGSFADEDFTGWQTMFITRNFDTGEITAHINGKTKNVFETASLGEVYSVGSFGQSNNQFFAGEIAYSALYNRVLTAQEIANWDPYNAPQQGLELFHAYTVGSGSTVYDVSGNNNHGTITNATLSNFWIKQDQFHWNLKKGFNKLRRFNGTSNYIQGDGSQGFSNINTQFRFTASFYYDASSSREHVLFQNVDNTSGDNGDIFYAAFEGHLFFLGFRDVSAGVWTNEVFTDPLNAGLYYVNGLYDGNGSWTATINGVAFTNTGSWSMAGAGGAFAIGKRTFASDRYFTGGIKFIEIYNSSDILAHRWSNKGNFVDEVGGLINQSASLGELYKAPYAPTGDTLSNPAGKWHNDAETEINFPHTAKLQVINEQFNYKPFFYKNAQLDDATAAYSMRKVIADYEGPLLNVIRSSDLQAQDFYPDSRGDLDTAAITSFVNDSTPVLDDYSGAAAAYSLRKLRSAYTGSAIEVRRSSNGDTLNIGFDANGDLDSTALLAFVNEDVDVYTSDFSSTEDLSESNGTGSAAQSVGGVDDAYKFTTITGTGQMFAYVQPFSGKGGGNEFRLQGDVYLPSTNTEIDKVRIFTSYGGETYADITTTDSWVSVDQTLTITNGSALRFQAFDGNDITPTTTEANAFYLKNIVVTQTTADGAVTTFYDQTQNDPVNQKNATQSDPAKMPLVVSGGTLVTENGKAAISFDGNDDELVIASSQSEFNQLHDGSNSTIIAVSTLSANSRFLGNDASSSSNIGFDLGYTSDIAHFIREGSGAANRPVVNIGGGVYSTNNQYLLFIDVDADNATADNRSSIYIDGGTPIKNNTSTASPSASDATFDLSIGSAGNNILNNNGKTQEIIIYLSDQSANRTGIESNIGRYYTIDGFADGRVATWYDQANTNHATNTTPDEQPLIVNDGVLVTENGKAAIQYDGVDDYFDTNLGTLTESSVFMLFRKTSAGGSSSVFGGAGNKSLGYVRENSRHRVFYVNSTAENITDSRTPPFTELVSFFRSGNATTLDLFRDGANKASLTSLASTVTNPTNFIGKLGGSNSYHFEGLIQELIFFDSADQSENRQDIEKNIADYYEITLSGNSGVESWVKNVSFADMYQIWFDYEYLHRLFANFEIPNKVFKVLAYTSELTADQRQQVYDYLQKNYHPIYTPYSTRVLADGGTLAAGQTNTLTIIDSI